MANNRIISFDVLRVIAAFAVVMLHVTSQRLDTSFLSNEWEIRNVYDSFVRWCVPVFFMISGALFLDHGRKINVGRLYKKNILHLIFIFFAWSFIYALYSATVRCDYNVSHIILRILEGPVHFWFLKILIGLYVAVPILRMISQNKQAEEYFLIVAIITAFVLPTIFTFIGLFNESLKSFVLYHYNAYGIRIASGYVGYFVLGHYLFSNRLSSVVKKFIYLMGLFSVLSVIFLTHWYCHRINASSEVFYDNLNVFTLIESVCVYLAINDLKISTKYHSLVLRLSNLSLGVYLSHVLVFVLLYELFGIDSGSFNPLFFIPCFSLIVFVLSCLIVALIKKIPILNKLVV
ncbi:MAG: acyltransferase family protein [Muribaculaceae bacterium]|nr:acyltransferase family protein [Muribaculaceae bacterium]MBR5673705.1 acyltransferase family protein [Muribaculaceae bacterium]